MASTDDVPLPDGGGRGCRQHVGVEQLLDDRHPQERVYTLRMPMSRPRPIGTAWTTSPRSRDTAPPAEMAQAGLTPVIKGVYSARAVGDRQILKYPYGYPPVVSARVRDAIEAAGCTGISFSRVPLV